MSLLLRKDHKSTFSLGNVLSLKCGLKYFATHVKDNFC